MAHKWYAIQTYSGSELSVKKALLQLSEEMADDRISDVLVPTEDLIEVKTMALIIKTEFKSGNDLLNQKVEFLEKRVSKIELTLFKNQDHEK